MPRNPNRPSELERRMFGHLNNAGDDSEHEPSQAELADMYREGKSVLVKDADGRSRYEPRRKKWTIPL